MTTQPQFKHPESPYKSNNTASGRCGFTLMNNQVGAVIAQVMATKPNVSVRYLPSMIRVDATGRMDVDYDEVSEALGEEHRAAGDGVKPNRFPLPEGRRISPQVHDHVKDRPGHAGYVLRLPGRYVGIVNAPDHSALGYRAVNLRHIQPVPEGGSEFRAAERLSETASVVVMHLGGVYPGSLNAQWIHGKDPTRAQASRPGALAGTPGREAKLETL